MEIRDIISLVISSAVMIITIAAFFIQNNAPPQTYIIFGIIILLIIITFSITSLIKKLNELNTKINKNKLSILEFQKSLNIKEIYNTMDKRIGILEKLIDIFLVKKNKKGQSFDIRILFWILLILLLILFLKSIGFF